MAANPKLLKWARERSGFTLDDVAARMKKKPSDIQDWEIGTKAPSYSQLEKLARDIYKRPVAILFFPEPPDEPDPSTFFRTLPKTEIDLFWPNTLWLLRQARAMQIALYELSDDHNDSRQLIFRDIRLTLDVDIKSAASDVRNYLGVGIVEQKSWKDSKSALAAWRQAVQNSGIYVFKNSFKQKDICGFCILDDEFPLIYLNNSVAVNRQIFSLLHELAHILFWEYGITKQDSSYIDLLPNQAGHIERSCNALAGEILVPTDDFILNGAADFYDDNFISGLSRSYCVSREVILRKALDLSIINTAHYNSKIREWSEAAPDHAKRSCGGNYYLTQASYLGARFIDLAFGKYYQNRITREQLADYLNVKAKHVEKFDPLTIG